MTPNTRLAMCATVLLSAGCATTTTYSRTYDAEPPAPLEGRVDSIREVVQRTEGDPAGGALAGGVIGGFFGGAITGRPLGAVVGALGGAATGAAVSQGARDERRWYEVRVRFDDGSWGRIDYGAPPPWRVGDRVRQGPNGLVRAAPRPAVRPRSEPPRDEPARDELPRDAPPDLTPPPPPREIPPPPM